MNTAAAVITIIVLHYALRALSPSTRLHKPLHSNALADSCRSTHCKFTSVISVISVAMQFEKTNPILTFASHFKCSQSKDLLQLLRKCKDPPSETNPIADHSALTPGPAFATIPLSGLQNSLRSV